jgi:phage repressor protein C with HTH and peptisase S24 domain
MNFDLSDKSSSVELLLARMNLFIREKGISEADFAARIGSSSALFKNLRKGSMPSVERLHAILSEMGDMITLGDRDSNNGLMVASAPLAMIDNEAFETVARYEVQSAAGNGVICFDSDPIDHLAFSKSWLERSGINAGSCVLINVAGKSMEPSIYDGDLVMVDRSKTAIRSGRIYVFRDGDEGLRMKRLEVIPDAAVTLLSDNFHFAPEHRMGEDMNAISENILGEVVWSSHKWN